MASRELRAIVLIALLLAPLAILAVACSRPDEQQYLTQFFRAARGRDNTTLALMSAVEFDPREQGAVEDFEITQIGQERRTPADYKTLADAELKAVAEDEAFRQRKIEYQNANLPALETIVKLERDPNAKMTPEQLKMKAEWDKWRADTTMHQKAVTSARMAFSNATGPAEASLDQPGQPPFDAQKFKGDLVSKDVTVSAEVRLPEGQMTTKTLTLILQRVSGTMDGEPREGRWIITRIEGV
jgi:hypothetical protein